ncbi:MAG TPA: SIMPL domain-containing protein [Candidatus Paceibacterota bacterium]
MTTENMNGEGHTCGSCSGGGCHGHGERHIKKGVFTLLAVAGAIYLFALAANTIAEHQYIGRDINSQTTISVSGDGEAFAAPDIATVSFSIMNESKNSVDARKIVDEKMKNVHDFLIASGVLDKDIRTTGYNLSPKYEWQQKQIVCIAYPCVQPPGKQVLTGYEVTQSVEVKVRNLDDAGKVLGGLSDNGVTNLSNLSFLVENEDDVQAQAREAAITKAKAKADQLAKDLGVKLVRIVSFNENGGNPYYYGGAKVGALSMETDTFVAADIPAGENKYASNVTIVYEIR